MIKAICYHILVWVGLLLMGFPLYAQEANSDAFVQRLNSELNVHSLYSRLKSLFEDEQDQKLLETQHKFFKITSHKVDLEFRHMGRLYEVRIDNKTWARIYNFDFEQKQMLVNGQAVSFASNRKYNEIHREVQKILTPSYSGQNLGLIPRAEANDGWLLGTAIASVALFGKMRFDEVVAEPLARCIDKTNVTDIFPQKSVYLSDDVREAYRYTKSGFKSGKICSDTVMPRNMDQRMRLMFTRETNGHFHNRETCQQVAMTPCDHHGFNMNKGKARVTCSMYYSYKQHCGKISSPAAKLKSHLPLAEKVGNTK